jgi:hypothetical protein
MTTPAHSETVHDNRWFAIAVLVECVAAIVVWLALAMLISGTAFAQSGTTEFGKVNQVDILTWTDGANYKPVFTEVQRQTGSDKTWRIVAMVYGTNTVTVPKDVRVTRYRIRHVSQDDGAASTWCYKSTR